MKQRGAILLALSIAEVVTIAYAVVRYVSVVDLGWGGYLSVDLPPLRLLVLLLVLTGAIGLLLLFGAEHAN